MRLCRNLNGWEIVEYQELLGLLSNIKLDNHSDQRAWNLGNHCNFSVKSFYCKLQGGMDNACLVFPVKQIWKTKSPPRMAFFAWEPCRESILTIDMLKQRGKILVN